MKQKISEFQFGDARELATKILEHTEKGEVAYVYVLDIHEFGDELSTCTVNEDTLSDGSTVRNFYLD